jgi:glyceraldehyde 3-phosphate dehydrogenase
MAGRATTPQEVNDALIAASEGRLKGVMTFTRHPLVSSDLNHDPHSCTILLDQTKVIDGDFVNILGWYDNEWGFSNRMVDVTKAFARTL